MSTHKDCGQVVKWARRPDDPNRWMPPLEYIGEVHVVTGEGENQSASVVHAYRVHHCDPDHVAAWTEYQEKLALARGDEYVAEASPHKIRTDQLREAAWEYALKRACPTCEQKKNEKCLRQDRALKIRGEVQECRNPHPARMEGYVPGG